MVRIGDVRDVWGHGPCVVTAHCGVTDEWTMKCRPGGGFVFRKDSYVRDECPFLFNVYDVVDMLERGAGYWDRIVVIPEGHTLQTIYLRGSHGEQVSSGRSTDRPGEWFADGGCGPPHYGPTFSEAMAALNPMSPDEALEAAINLLSDETRGDADVAKVIEGLAALQEERRG